MSDLRLTAKDTTTTAPVRTHAKATGEIPAETGKIGTDKSAFSGEAHAAAGADPGLETYPVGEEHHGEEHTLVDDIAHKAHNPHGALHAVEAGEVLVKGGARLVTRAARGASVAAEVVHHPGQGHHGLLGRLEAAVETGVSRLGKWFGAGIAKIPGGQKFLDGTSKLLGAPGRALGPGVDAALAGTRLGKAAQFTGSGGRLVANMGGRIPVIGALLGGAIAWVDARSSLKILNDPKASGAEKAVAGAQGGLSVVSGLAGVGALGVAAAAAIGFTAPVSVPLLLGVAAVTGIASFALSFFKKH